MSSTSMALSEPASTISAVADETPASRILKLLVGSAANEVSSGTVSADATLEELARIAKGLAPDVLRGHKISRAMARHDLKLLKDKRFRK